MKVYQAQRLGELGGAEFFDRKQDFRGVEAEFGVVARGRCPAPLAAGLQLGAKPDHGFYPGFLGNADDIVEFGELFDDDDDLLAEFTAQEREADVVVVLVAVADDQSLRTLVHGEGDHQLGLRTGLEAIIEVLAGGHDFVDHLAKLVNLDREDAAVVALVALILDRLGEQLVQLDDAMPEEVLEPDDHRGLEPHANSLMNDVEHPDPPAVDQGLDVHKPFVVDRDMSGTPAFETVVFFGFGRRPGGGGFAFQRGAGRGEL